jgi:flagellar hook-associated protein 3 FlgL
VRITFDMTYRNGLADINRASDAFMRAQREVSSGKRLHVPSDDPSATARVIGEYAEQRSLDSYAKASDSVESRLMVADSVLTDVILRLQDAQVKAAAAANSFLTQAQRDALALELEGIRDALLTAINQQFRGTYVFSGTQITVAPYEKDASGAVGAYQGNAESQRVDVDRARDLAVTFDGAAVMGDVFESVEQLVSAVRAGNTAGPGFTVADGMAKLNEAFSRATTMQSRVGAMLNDVDEQQGRLAEVKRASVARRSSLEDANLAEAISKLQQARTAHESALAAVAAAGRPSLLDYLK